MYSSGYHRMIISNRILNTKRTRARQFLSNHEITSKPKQMQMRKNIFKPIVLILACLLCLQEGRAQLTVAAQLRTRSELRDGQGAPLSQSAKPAFFTSQRTRVALGYGGYRLKMGVSVQDVRVWGQDVSTINRTTVADNNGLMLHEAWAEIMLTDSMEKNKILALKLGRQELVYDDSRLIGNLDWTQQARRHDAAVLKYETANWMVHLAGAFNQNKENASGTLYNSTPSGNYPANTNGGSMYKSMQFLYAAKKWNAGSLSFLFFSDQFSKFRNDSVNNGYVKTFEAGSWNRFTTGLYFTTNWNQLMLTSSAYYQFGHYDSQKKLDAGLVNVALQYAFNKKFSMGPGVDYTTGGANASTSHAFDPLYGTPHKFWGLMDYFYAANPFGKTGLVDYYLKSKWKASDAFALTADYHHFNSATDIAGTNKRSFGDEIDFTTSVGITKQISLEGGYCHYFGTTVLTAPTVKNIANPDLGSNWAYVMINIRPAFLLK
jgi:hypothetical protein